MIYSILINIFTREERKQLV